MGIDFGFSLCQGPQFFLVLAFIVQEVVADKGYHSNEVVRTLAEARIRSYISEPERGARKWEGRPEERAAVLTGAGRSC